MEQRTYSRHACLSVCLSMCLSVCVVVCKSSLALPPYSKITASSMKTSRRTRRTVPTTSHVSGRTSESSLRRGQDAHSCRVDEAYIFTGKAWCSKKDNGAFTTTHSLCYSRPAGSCAHRAGHSILPRSFRSFFCHFRRLISKVVRSVAIKLYQRLMTSC